jgi:hypothetical protein
MPGKLTFLVIHCTATPQGREVSGDEIRQWHMGPADQPDGTVRYLGNTYPNRAALPPDKIGGIAISRLQGRGWRKVGYSDIIHLNGWVENLMPYNDDDTVDAWEVTNGVASVNAIARHVVYAGGKSKDNKQDIDTRTPGQQRALLNYCVNAIAKVPALKLAGHNQFDVKACPSFSVPAWAAENNIQKKNIYSEPLKVKL